MRQIFGGVLKPNDGVTESEIASQMGISRAPVREALRELQKDGLIVSYPRKGTYVADITEEDLKEIYTLRALLESHGATQAKAYFHCHG